MSIKKSASRSLIWCSTWRWTPRCPKNCWKTVTTADESKKDIQEKDREYMARSRAAAEYCARTLGWQRIECTCAGRAMRPVEEINAEILAKTDRIL